MYIQAEHYKTLEAGRIVAYSRLHTEFTERTLPLPHARSSKSCNLADQQLVPVRSAS